MALRSLACGAHQRSAQTPAAAKIARDFNRSPLAGNTTPLPSGTILVPGHRGSWHPDDGLVMVVHHSPLKGDKTDTDGPPPLFVLADYHSRWYGLAATTTSRGNNRSNIHP